MLTDITVSLHDRPGMVARLGELLGEAGINIEGGFTLVVGGQGLMHVLVEDGRRAVGLLDEEGFDVRDAQPVEVFHVANEPGALGALARRMANAGANLTVLYFATDTRLVIGADDLNAVRAAMANG